MEARFLWGQLWKVQTSGPAASVSTPVSSVSCGCAEAGSHPGVKVFPLTSGAEGAQ